MINFVLYFPIITVYFIDNTSIAVPVIFIILIIAHIIVYLINRCIKYINSEMYRIDCIYSKDFDRIFIGIVNYSITSYIDSFELQMNL